MESIKSRVKRANRARSREQRIAIMLGFKDKQEHDKATKKLLKKMGY
jgi:diphthamide synthase subunit DPH2